MRGSPKGRVVGRIAGLWRYPVKSMAAEPLAEADVSWHGFSGDRRWAFIRDGMAQSGFPWLTLRERAEMAHYHPSFVEPGRPDKSATVVRTPAGAVLDVTDPALAAELWPAGARVIKQDRGDVPFPEDDWVGRVLAAGDWRFRIDKRDGRCAVITIDPATTERNPEILRKVAQHREGCLGVYGTTVQPGRIAVGDALTLDDANIS